MKDWKEIILSIIANLKHIQNIRLVAKVNLK